MSATSNTPHTPLLPYEQYDVYSKEGRYAGDTMTVESGLSEMGTIRRLQES